MAPVYYNGVDVTRSYLGRGTAFIGIPTPSGSELWTPAEISTTIWLDASDETSVTLSGSQVTQWADLSGNNNNFTQTGALCPTYGTNIKNGLNAISFNNLSTNRQYLNNTSFQYAGDTLHMYSVHINDSAAGPTTFGRLFSFAANGVNDFDNVSGILLTYGATTGISLYRNSAVIASTSAIDDTWALVDAQRNGTSGKISLNGNAYTSGSTAANNQNIQRSRIGNDFAAGDSGMDGYIAENILLTYIPTDDTNQKIQGYLAWKWGLEANLPAGHPYKDAPPYV